MKAIDRQFTRLINGTTQFVIPVFQRDYSWSEAHCQQLWNDIVRVGRGPDTQGHFIGSVVYIPSGDTAAGFTRWLLIDGQQRLTTVTLLLLALRDHLIQTDWQANNDDDPTPKRIDAYYLRNMQEEGDRQQKLVLRRTDQRVLQALLDRTEPSDEDSRIRENYEFFREKVGALDPAIVYRGVARLVVVDVALDRASDDPQMIFESLNSTGLDLSQADLIRNFILMRMDEKTQTRLYDTYWRHIEDLFRGAPKTLDSFARDYMALKTKATKQTRADQIYHEFRYFFRSHERDHGTDAVLQDMRCHAGYYAAFAGTGPAPQSFAHALQRLSQLAEVAAIVVMRLLECHDRKKTLSAQELASALELLESFVFRRAVCALQTRGYNQFFSNLAQRISDTTPLQSLQLALATPREANRFPSDDEFRLELERRDVYHMRTCHYMLDRLENFDTKEPSDTATYTIEHVLPQNERLSKAWREMLGSDWKDVQAAWVHRLGNLTLTGYNSTYSDRSFADKKTIAGGFNDSAVRLNRYVREQAQWTAAEMQRRGRTLGGIAGKVWPGVSVSPELLARSRRAELEAETSQHRAADIPMVEAVRRLYEYLRPLIMGIDPKIIEVPRRNSIAYYADDGDFFCEVLPRKSKLILLLNLTLDECAYKDEYLSDATEYKFIVNAEHDGGVIYRFRSSEQRDGALRVIHQAYELAAQ